MEWREKDLALVIDALGVENSLAGVALERGGMDRKLGADFGRALPSGRAFLLGETWDLIGMADPPHGQAGEALPGSGTQPAGIERGGNLTIGLGAGKSRISSTTVAEVR